MRFPHGSLLKNLFWRNRQERIPDGVKQLILEADYSRLQKLCWRLFGISQYSFDPNAEERFHNRLRLYQEWLISLVEGDWREVPPLATPLWYAHQLDVKNYQDFCFRIFGFVLHIDFAKENLADYFCSRPVGFLPGTCLNTEQAGKLRYLEEYNWGRVRWIARQIFAIRSDEEFEELLQEYKRWRMLCLLGSNHPMYSEQVDKIWHSHILDSVGYEEFLVRFQGQITYHCPNFGNLGFTDVKGDTPQPPSTPQPPPQQPSCAEDQNPSCNDNPKTPRSSLSLSPQSCRDFVEDYRRVFGNIPLTIWEVESVSRPVVTVETVHEYLQRNQPYIN